MPRALYPEMSDMQILLAVVRDYAAPSSYEEYEKDYGSGPPTTRAPWTANDKGAHARQALEIIESRTGGEDVDAITPPDYIEIWHSKRWIESLREFHIKGFKNQKETRWKREQHRVNIRNCDNILKIVNLYLITVKQAGEFPTPTQKPA